jgi:predicted TIM-barrel fold metal-dependent hydrolase
MSAAAHPDEGIEPAYPPPEHACDAHFHIFGPAEKYRHVTDDLRYAPPYAPLDGYMPLARRLGVTRFVLVQPSAYGIDNACMLDAMAEIAPELRRGIIQFDDTAPDDAALQRWDDFGVRGARINVSPVRQPEAGLADALRPKIVRTAAICRELGWHIDLLLPGWLIDELLATLHELPVAFSVAHMGLYQAEKGLAQPGFRQFLSLVNDGSKRCWVKLTGVYRFSRSPNFTDVAPFAEALIGLAPDRMIWGSDFPHLSFHDKVGTIMLYNKLGEWAPDAATRRRILADNPARLYGFA